jgi:hypothetical protein
MNLWCRDTIANGAEIEINGWCPFTSGAATFGVFSLERERRAR